MMNRRERVAATWKQFGSAPLGADGAARAEGRAHSDKSREDKSPAFFCLCGAGRAARPCADMKRTTPSGDSQASSSPIRTRVQGLDICDQMHCWPATPTVGHSVARSRAAKTEHEAGVYHMLTGQAQTRRCAMPIQSAHRPAPSPQRRRHSCSILPHPAPCRPGRHDTATSDTIGVTYSGQAIGFPRAALRSSRTQGAPRTGETPLCPGHRLRTSARIAGRLERAVAPASRPTNGRLQNSPGTRAIGTFYEAGDAHFA